MSAAIGRRPSASRPTILAPIAVFAFAFAVAAGIKRAPPNFSRLPPLAKIEDETGRALWVIRMAPRAHQIAVDAVENSPTAAGQAYQLWLADSDNPQSLGLLPSSGRKVIPESPALIEKLAGGGVLLISLEKARGSDTPWPNGPVLYRANFGHALPNCRRVPPPLHGFREKDTMSRWNLPAASDATGPAAPRSRW